ncbi:MAG: histidine kinase [Bacteroidota bacterium]
MSSLFLNREDRIKLIGFDDTWLTIIGIGIVTGISYMLFSPTVIQEFGEQAFLACAATSLGFTLFYWFSCKSVVIYFRKKLARPEQTSRRLLLTAASVLGIVVGSELIQSLINSGIGPKRELTASGIDIFIYDIVFTLVLCFMVIALYESIYFFVKYRQNAVEKERLARSQMQSQLGALRQQINPHFLFNSLNTLSSLIPEDPHKANLFTQRLASVYRRLTAVRHEPTISLEEEIKALEDYTFLLKSRFEDKLRVEIDIPDYLRRSQIPPLSLQLLLENVVKHNALSSKQPISVRIASSESGIHIGNNRRAKLRKSLPGQEPRKKSTGLGLENIQQRYAFFTDQQVQILETPDSFEVILPIIWTTSYEQASA